MPKTWFVSRHEGAIAWAKKQNLPITDWSTHMDINMLQPGDIIIGTLPIHIAAEVCAMGVTFYFLQINVPASLRGKELTLEQMMQFNCKITQFSIIQIGD